MLVNVCPICLLIYVTFFDQFRRNNPADSCYVVTVYYDGGSTVDMGWCLEVPHEYMGLNASSAGFVLTLFAIAVQAVPAYRLIALYLVLDR